ncbi:hypothetical protein JG687_00013278 [Phytophthora cactorum]|uniref:Uncharacterized protein n=1 Tax=Phytophthora cactorum TaxID=29920 RepID=A0A8T1TZF8_9STRA|nr:hypothetical protein JG687_00013278 [Phytophthora cactorum]
MRTLTTKLSTGSESAASANAKFAPTESEAWVNVKLQSTIAQDTVHPTKHEPTCATSSGHTTRRIPLLALKYGTSYGIMAKTAHALVVGETYRIVKPG